MSWTGPGLAERPWLAPLLLALAVLAVYGQTLGFSLVWDDPLILDHLADHARSGTLLSADYGYLSHLPIGYWRPLHVLSLWLDRAIGGGDPWAFRAGSLLLYLASVLILHRFALALLRPGGAFLAALLFAVWPTHTESLGMVTNRHDLLASVFLLLSLLAWERSRRQGAPGWALPAGGAAFLFAALSKESALVLPGALLLWDLILPAPGGASGGAVRGWWRRNRGWLPWWAGAGAASLLLRLALFGPAFGTQAGYPHAGGGPRRRAAWPLTSPFSSSPGR